LPSTFDSLSDEEKAFVIASIDVKMEADKKRQKEIESKTKR
jgi:hypothetical protein